jgi:hypothetical protein
MTSDPLSEVIALLQPRTVFSKRISGAGRWSVRYSDFGQPSFCAVLEGRCRLAVDGHARSRWRRATSCCCRRRRASPCRASSR